MTEDTCTADAEPKIYAQISETDALIRTIEEYLEDYNSVSTSPMRLVTFLDAAEHVARVARVLRTPLGHALLLGVGGSGRRSLARLAAHVEEYETREIEITKSYGPVDWKDDLRAALKSAGAAGKDVALIFSDTQVCPTLHTDGWAGRWFAPCVREGSLRKLSAVYHCPCGQCSSGLDFLSAAGVKTVFQTVCGIGCLHSSYRAASR